MTLETVFDVCVLHEHRFHKSFVTFDFESILRQKSSSQQQSNGFDTNQDDCFIKTKKLEFTYEPIIPYRLQYIETLQQRNRLQNGWWKETLTFW